MWLLTFFLVLNFIHNNLHQTLMRLALLKVRGALYQESNQNFISIALTLMHKNAAQSTLHVTFKISTHAYTHISG